MAKNKLDQNITYITKILDEEKSINSIFYDPRENIKINEADRSIRMVKFPGIEIYIEGIEMQALIDTVAKLQDKNKENLKGVPTLPIVGKIIKVATWDKFVRLKKQRGEIQE